MQSLRDLHVGNTGKVSDKWDLYLTVYNNLYTPYRDLPGLNLLEIGVQNGGSLETWARFFPSANRIVGFDVNPLCKDLVYDDKRISVLTGDCASLAARNSISSACSSYDLIIEDASHTSDNIIQTFVSLFPLLKPGGIYVSEDLHCSYWSHFRGGLNYGLSSISFFKRLVDGINSGSWEGGENEILSPFSDFLQNYQLEAERLELCIRELSSVEFHDSMCVLRKRCEDVPSRLGRRVVSGKEAAIEPAVLDVHSQPLIASIQSGLAPVSETERLRIELDRIYSSRSWKLLSWLRRLMRR